MPDGGWKDVFKNIFFLKTCVARGERQKHATTTQQLSKYMHIHTNSWLGRAEVRQKATLNKETDNIWSRALLGSLNHNKMVEINHFPNQMAFIKAKSSYYISGGWGMTLEIRKKDGSIYHSCSASEHGKLCNWNNLKKTQALSSLSLYSLFIFLSLSLFS